MMKVLLQENLKIFQRLFLSKTFMTKTLTNVKL